MARPTDYTAELAELICTRLASGRVGLRTLCEADDMPSSATIYRWLARHKTFAEQYARAMEARTDAMAEEILEIADDGRNDSYESDGRQVTDRDVIARSRLRVDARKWLMSRLAPKKYGDRVTQVQVGDPDNPVHTVTRIERVIIPAVPADQPHGEDACAAPAESSQHAPAAAQ
jgi:hypothetical protein